MKGAEAERWKRLVELPRVVRHWGHDYEVTPRLLPYIFGDGGKWMALAPLNARPNYYVIQIDSRLNLSSHAEQPTLIDTCLDDTFGRMRDSEDGDDALGEPWPGPGSHGRKRVVAARRAYHPREVDNRR